MAEPLPFRRPDQAPQPPRPRETAAPITRLRARTRECVARLEAEDDAIETSDPRGDPTLDVTLIKDDRRKRYWIRPGRDPGTWFCQVFWRRQQHRGGIVDLSEAQRQRAEYAREIQEHLADGWAREP